MKEALCVGVVILLLFFGPPLFVAACVAFITWDASVLLPGGWNDAGRAMAGTWMLLAGVFTLVSIGS